MAHRAGRSGGRSAAGGPRGWTNRRARTGWGSGPEPGTGPPARAGGTGQAGRPGGYVLPRAREWPFTHPRAENLGQKGGGKVLTDEQMEGTPSIQFEAFIRQEEAEIRALAAGDEYQIRRVVSLLIECWNAKKCPYG